MSDQPLEAGKQEASMSPEVADYFGQTNPQAPVKEQVKADDTAKKVVEDGKKEADDKSKSEDKSKEPETKKPEEKADKPKEGKVAETPTEFEVAGRKYATIEKAIEAVNSINGNNSRLVGNVKELKEEKTTLTTRVAELEKLLSDYKSANEDWQKYYDEGGDKPDETKVNLEEAIVRTLDEREKRGKEATTKAQYSTELDEILKEDDFEQVKTFFEDLMSEYDGVPKVGPKKLYERARKEYKQSLGNDELKDIESMDKLVNERVIKELAKREAGKGTSASGGSAKNDDSYAKMSPEVAEYFKNR